MHCHRFIPTPLTRREMLIRGAQGFGAVASSALLDERAFGAASPLPHFRPRARSVVFLYMDGGPSQVDTFDHKPLLEKHDGQDPATLIGKLEPDPVRQHRQGDEVAVEVPAARRERTLGQRPLSRTSRSASDDLAS